MVIGNHVWYFDPYDAAKLKRAWIYAINCHGPELYTDRGVLAYSRRAVWASKTEAEKNGPPHEVYTYSRKNAKNFIGATA